MSDEIEAIREDAHDGESTVEHLRAEHLRVMSRKRTVDVGDLVIFGGWLLAMLFAGALITVIIYALN